MFIGTAAWTIPNDHSINFPPEGSHLERYSLIFNSVEINSSFYREHNAKTYERWANSVPGDFRFSVKLNKKFIHDCVLKPDIHDLRDSLNNILCLKEKLGVILIQLPGSLGLDYKVAVRFLTNLRKIFDGQIALEPRNLEWVSEDANKIYKDFKVSKVIADPERAQTEKSTLLDAGGFRYYRLHGSPVIYRSQYSDKFLTELQLELKDQNNSWCIFDNTQFGHATGDALSLMDKLSPLT